VAIDQKKPITAVKLNHLSPRSPKHKFQVNPNKPGNKAMQVTTPTLQLNQDLADTHKFQDSHDSFSLGGGDQEQYFMNEAAPSLDKPILQQRDSSQKDHHDSPSQHKNATNSTRLTLRVKQPSVAQASSSGGVDVVKLLQG